MAVLGETTKKLRPASERGASTPKGRLTTKLERVRERRKHKKQDAGIGMGLGASLVATAPLLPVTAGIPQLAWFASVAAGMALGASGDSAIDYHQTFGEEEKLQAQLDKVHRAWKR